ncbi:MAG TPA: single-stranded-DNA-specific exonuclease RecJ [Polyangiaceae bacterium]|nr:single-stranded-DNA-specific exonuclease RecJ [Polyangiaceae bacterium]
MLSSAPSVVQVTRRPTGPSGEVSRIAAELGVSYTFAAWLRQRGFDASGKTRDFLNPKLSGLTLPDGMADRDVAAQRLARAVRAREKIVVFGDYDCDGMTATAILTEILRMLGGDVTPLLASRFDGGYGLSRSAVQRIQRERPGLLVTCDCGSSDHVALEELSRSGVQAIVVDHHLVPEAPLPALAFLNPHRKDCGFAYKGLASCGLVLSLGGAVRRALDKKLELKAWLDLVAIGTVADVAPLDGDNRALVRAGLHVLAAPERPGLKALLSEARIGGGGALTAEDIAFSIAPRLNAPGRLGAPDVALALLLSRSESEAYALAARLEQASAERKAQQEKLQDEALDEIAREGYAERSSLVLGRAGWNHGIVGIVAGRLADSFARPVVVCAIEGGRARGSVRGPAQARLHDLLQACSPLLERFGGHQAAAGLELRSEKLPEFREAFEAATRAQAAVAAVRPVEPAEDAASVWLDLQDSPDRVLRDFAMLEPCGRDNPTPRLLVETRVLAARAVKGGHLKLELELSSGQKLSGFGPRLGDLSERLGATALLCGRLRRDRYRGGDALELHVESVL